MTDGLALEDKRVLVVEDDYYQATEEAAAIEGAGGTVVGCTAVASEALALMQREQIDCALVDINLGSGPAFETAQALRDHHVPFIFTTGYNAAIIPTEFQDVLRLEKPFHNRKLITTIVSIL